MKTQIKKIIILIGSGIVAGIFANAQIIPEPLSLISSPSSPSPGQIFIVQASTPTIDKNSSFFSWTIDGKARPDLSGIGKNSVSLAAGEVGSTIKIETIAADPRGNGGKTSITVRVSDLALTWYAETYIPAWYRGKALPIQNSVVGLVAVPNFVIGGIAERPENLIYRWGLDDEDGAEAGAGKQVFRVQTSDISKTSHRVTVTVEDLNKTISKKAELFIVPTLPRVVIYKNSPLGGIETRSAPALFSISARGQVDFSAEPFFFSVFSRKNLPYKWNIGGVEAQGESDTPNLISINTGTSPVAAIPLSVSVQPAETFISAVSKTITLLLR